jgi:hypothetical protein
MVLVAQSVPSATRLPCIDALPAGWMVNPTTVDDGETRFSLDSDRAGANVVEVRLLPPSECHTANATEVPSDEANVRRFEQVRRLRPGLRATRTYRFPGGCVTYEFATTVSDRAGVLFDADRALAFQARAPLVEEVRDRAGLSLCGAGAPPCPGGTS